MLKFKNKLSTRVALPMLAMGFGMACVILVAVWNMQVRLHKQESLEKAQIVADALEIGAQTFANVQELIEFAQAFGSKL